MRSLEELGRDYKLQSAADFTTIAKCLLRANSLSEVGAIAEASYLGERVQRVLKAAVTAGGFTNEAGPLADLNTVAAGFVSSLQSISLFDRMLPDMVRVPMMQPNVVAVTSAIIGDDPFEARAKAISTISLAGSQLDRRKATAQVVISNELAKNMSGAASALLAQQLRMAVAGSTDMAFLDIISEGVTPVGGSPSDVLPDLALMLDAMTIGNTSRLYLIVDGTTAKRLATSLRRRAAAQQRLVTANDRP